MLLKYEQAWPDHPFIFRIPYQQLRPDTTTVVRQTKIESRRTEVSIRSTVLALLEDLDDEEMVYWCIDDKYPIQLSLNRIRSLFAGLKDHDLNGVDGLLFCRCRRMWEQDFLSGQTWQDHHGHLYLERRGYEQIWIHQLLRVKVIRYLFTQFPIDINFAKQMDSLKAQVAKPREHRLFVSQHNLARFGESTSSGKVTRNCRISMAKHGLPLPTAEDGEPGKTIIMGSARDELTFDPENPRLSSFIKALGSKLQR
jgi:hypothetical protein